jgi:hypothetical protein
MNARHIAVSLRDDDIGRFNGRLAKALTRKYIEHKWICGKGHLETPPKFEIIRYGEPKNPAKGVIKNSKGASFTLGDVALIGNERYYILAVPPQSFDDIPAPDEIRLVLIPEKTLDILHFRQTSEEFQAAQKKFAELQDSYKKDKASVDEKTIQETYMQLMTHIQASNELLANTVVAKRAGDIIKAGESPLKQEDKDAFMKIIGMLHHKDNKLFLFELINIALSNLAKEEVAGD